MKRQLLDQLAARHDFPVPQSMVDAEFQNIMNQLRHEATHEDDQAAALAEIEKDSPEYRHIAERRVRLGLLLSEIGAGNGVQVSEQEMNRLIGQAASQYQGKDRDAFIRYVQQEPMAAAQLRAPLYEDKVVDFLFSKADVAERKSTRAEIEADLESEEGHVHGPNCGHDHAPKPKKAKGRPRPRPQRPNRKLRPRARSKPRNRPSPSRPSRSRTALVASPRRNPRRRRRPRPRRRPRKVERPGDRLRGFEPCSR